MPKNRDNHRTNLKPVNKNQGRRPAAEAKNAMYAQDQAQHQRERLHKLLDTKRKVADNEAHQFAEAERRVAEAEHQEAFLEENHRRLFERLRHFENAVMFGHLRPNPGLINDREDINYDDMPPLANMGPTRPAM